MTFRNRIRNRIGDVLDGTVHLGLSAVYYTILGVAAASAYAYHCRSVLRGGE